MRWTKKMKIISLLFSLLLSAALATSVYMVWQEFSIRQKEKADFKQLAELVETVPSEVETEVNTEAAEDAGQTEGVEPVITGRNLAPLFEQNPDCIGWLCIEGTSVNYPLMHTPEDAQRYLRLNFNKEYSSAGTPFLDGRCSMERGNLIIYGHNRKDGSMFADLKKYLNQDFYDSHKTIELETAECIYTFTVIEVRITNTSDEWYNVIQTEVLEDKRYLTLSTCYTAVKNGRLMVIAVEENCVYKTLN